MKAAAALLFLGLAIGCDEKAEPTAKAEPTEKAEPPAKAEPTEKAEPPAKAELQQGPAEAPSPAIEAQTAEDKAFVESMQTLCRIADEVKADPAVVAQNRASETARRFSATKPPADVLKFLGTMATTGPQARTEKLAAEMAKRGRPGWSCSTLNEVVH